MQKTLIDPHTGYRWVQTPKRRANWVRRVWAHGGGLNVTIPPDVSQRLNLVAGSYLHLTVVDGKISLAPFDFVGQRKRGKNK